MTAKEYFKEMCGYDLISTLWDDLSVADRFGKAAIKDTYNRIKKGWKHHYKMMTEFVLILNHKIWQHYNKGNQEYAELYNGLWQDADNYCRTNFKGEKLKYFYRVTD